jgi:hypothetical protein
MVRVAEACGCVLWVVTDDMARTPIRAWPFDDIADDGERHLPAHLEVWRLERAWEWSSFHKYTCYADPPFPEFSYVMRRRRSSITKLTDQTDLGEGGQSRPTYPS